jgi:2-C-methyl-D-erythritol 4-phosphate cytidylyltransferase
MNKKTIVIILAGGEGKRFGLSKQFISIHNIPLFIYTIKKFKDFQIVLTIPEEYRDLVENNIKSNNCSKNIVIIKGGNTRKKSCYNALTYINNNYPSCENVVITEANRPCIKKETIAKCIKKLNKFDALITVCKSINTSCISKNKKTLNNILDRTYQYDLLMPECFKFKKLYSAYQKDSKDTTSIVEIFKSAYPNNEIGIILIPLWDGLKLTYAEDYKIFEMLLKKEK